MTERERLLDRLFNDPHKKLLNFHIFPGPGPFTEEELYREMNSALDQEAIGTATISASFEDDRPTVDVLEWLASLDRK